MALRYEFYVFVVETVSNTKENTVRVRNIL